MPSQVCITRDNTQLQVDGILYFQVTDPMRASATAPRNYIVAITQLRADHAALRHRQDGARQDVRGARPHQRAIVVNALDEAAANWGVKVLRYEIKDLTPPRRDPARDAGADHGRAREARADRGVRRPRARSRSTSPPASARRQIARSEGEKQAEINKAQGEAAAIVAVAEATADAIRKIAAAIDDPGGMASVNLKVAQQYVAAFEKLAKTGNTLIVPADLGNVASLIASAMQTVRATGAGPVAPR